MTSKNYDQQILRALNPVAESAHDKRVREVLEGGEFLYGLPEPEADYEDTVRAWAARESLKSAAERYAVAAPIKGKPRLSDEQMTQVVQETFDLTNESWSDITRMERTAAILDSHAARFEQMEKR